MSKLKIGIIGGGLGGLSLSILAAQQGYEVVLFEKNSYPFQRVCGEYISLESHQFLKNLGLPLDKWQLPIIQNLEISSPKGNIISSNLPLGGIGISRYFLDEQLANLARSQGVLILEKHTVSDVTFIENDANSKNGQFQITAKEKTIEVDVCVGSFGKKSNLDVLWKRPFVYNDNTRISNYIGVKYHIKTDFPKDKIALHNFEDGYCGISAIEDEKYCLCYLTTAKNLKNSANSIDQMQQDVLYKNQKLKHIFENSDFITTEPVTISQINFESKSLVENHVLLLGDAAGMISPLCGNGMSMALHASKIAFGCIEKFANGEISRAEMEKRYIHHWKKEFNLRLWVGRQIQQQFGSELKTEMLVRIMKPFPFLVKKLIGLTHGKPF